MPHLVLLTNTCLSWAASRPFRTALQRRKLAEGLMARRDLNGVITRSALQAIGWAAVLGVVTGAAVKHIRGTPKDMYLSI